MYIELREIDKIGNGGCEYTFQSNIVRYIEFEDCVVFLLKNNTIISIKEETNPISRYLIAWEIDYKKDIINEFSKYEENQITYLRVIVNSDYLFLINPCNGVIFFETPTKH